eukprot:scaffold2462_cov127-Cylindrotheca_fusiformis.AAC.3
MAKKKKHDNMKRKTGGLQPMENPLFTKQREFLQKLSETERTELFNPAINSERRAELWMEQAELGEAFLTTTTTMTTTDLVNRYAWATPSPEALRIVKEFAPIVEIGCGANAYWASCMKREGIDVVAYDMHVETGGKIKHENTTSRGYQKKEPSIIRKGGPSSLKHHADRSLFLCYPDEEGEGMGAECLEHFKGTHVIHVGETFLDSNFASDQAPYGRSSSSQFQERLASEFHCIVKVELPNWVHVRDSISVWKRSQTSTIVFAADSDEEDGDDEEIEYRHIPCSERLPMNIAAPCCEHLLPANKTAALRGDSAVNGAESRSRSYSGDPSVGKHAAETTKEADSVGSPTKGRFDSADSARKGQRDRSDSTDSSIKKKKKRRRRSDSTDSKEKHTDKKESSTLGRERSNSTDSSKKRKKTRKDHQQSVDSLFKGGFDEDNNDPSSGGRTYGEYVTPW